MRHAYGTIRDEANLNFKSDTRTTSWYLDGTLNLIRRAVENFSM